jgi:hypothetical protein
MSEFGTLNLSLPPLAFLWGRAVAPRRPRLRLRLRLRRQRGMRMEQVRRVRLGRPILLKPNRALRLRWLRLVRHARKTIHRRRRMSHVMLLNPNLRRRRRRCRCLGLNHVLNPRRPWLGCRIGLVRQDGLPASLGDLLEPKEVQPRESELFVVEVPVASRVARGGSLVDLKFEHGPCQREKIKTEEREGVSKKYIN